MDFNRIPLFIHVKEIIIIGSQVQGGLNNIITHHLVLTQWVMDVIQNMTFKTCRMHIKTSKNNFEM